MNNIREYYQKICFSFVEGQNSYQGQNWNIIAVVMIHVEDKYNPVLRSSL